MTLEAIIFLHALVSSIVCDPVTHVYPADCAPPDGFEGNDTGVTTPNYVTLRPIERCCPQCDKCQHLGGFCALKWAVDLYPGCCDFAPVEPCRDYSCKCCIKCGDDKCSPCVETGGECRKECRSGELEDNKNVCSYPDQDGTGCKCCKKCETTEECTDDYGWCMTDPASCPHGTFASTGCCGGCYCCKPVLEPVVDSTCANTPGCYCSETGDDCASGYYACFGECSKTLHHAGLESVVVGYSCIPKRTVTPPPIQDCSYEFAPPLILEVEGSCLQGFDHNGLTYVGNQGCKSGYSCWIAGVYCPKVCAYPYLNGTVPGQCGLPGTPPGPNYPDNGVPGHGCAEGCNCYVQPQ